MSRHTIIFLAITAFGAFLRLYHFDLLPYGINNDGAQNGLVAIEMWQKLPHYIPYYQGWVGETLYAYYQGLLFYVLGISPVILRLGAVLISVATLPVFYLVAKTLTTKTTALWGEFFLSLSSWHLVISKPALYEILVPLFQPLAVLAFIKALKTQKIGYWVLTGFLLAVSLNTYGAARITPVILVSALGLWWLNHRHQTLVIIKNGIILTLVFLFAYSPMINFAMHDWATFTGRAGYMFIGNKSNWPQLLVKNIHDSLYIFYRGAVADEFFSHTPLLEKVPGVMLVVGLGFALWSAKRWEYQVLLAWFLLGFVPGLIGEPNGNHNISVLVPAFILVGLGLAELKSTLDKKIPVVVILAVVLILCSLTAGETYRHYYSPAKWDFYGYYPETYIVGNYMRTKADLYDFYLTDNYPRDAVTFITYTGGDPWEKHYTWLESNTDFLMVPPLGSRGIIFFMFDNPDNQIVANQLLAKFPQARQEQLLYQNGTIKRVASLMVVVPPTPL